MRKSLISILTGLVMMGICASAWAGVTATDVVCTGCVNDTDIAPGTVTNIKIADGAVNDAKITGPISASKIQKPANVITVATSGGDFTSVSVALASLPDPNTTPTVIEVQPGTYIDSFSLKSYVHLRGSGKEVTTIEGKMTVPNDILDVMISGFKIHNTGNYAIECDYCKNLNVSNNSITGGGLFLNNYYESGPSGNHEVRDNTITGCSYGMIVEVNSSTRVIISNNTISGNIGDGINGWGTGKVKIIGNEITGNGNSGINIAANPLIITGNNVSYNGGEGISAYKTSIINGNTVIGNSGRGIICSSTCDSFTVTDNVIANNGSGISSQATTSKISGNTISGHSSSGVLLFGSASLLNNSIVGSGNYDVYIPSGNHTVSLNVFDSVNGPFTGSFNVKSDGTPW